MPEPEVVPLPVFKPAPIQRPVSAAVAKATGHKLWAVIAYYNPGKFVTRRTNYELCVTNLVRQNVPVCTVELCTSSETAELTSMPVATAQTATYKNIYHAVYSPSVLWAKEVLLNIGETLLPPDCQFVCWADADLIWDDDQWASKVVQYMSQPSAPVVIQPFEICHQMQPGETFEKDYKHLQGEDRQKNACMPMARQYVEQPTSYINTGNPFAFHAGYAWVIRRDIMNQMGGLFEYCILGQADYCMALAFTHNFDRDRMISNDWNIDGTFNWGQRLLDKIRAWQRHAASVVKGRLGYMKGVRVYHNFHGHPANRQYRSRGRLINDLDPDSDLTKDKSGMLCFTASAKQKGMPERIVEYFQKRQEDSTENPNKAKPRS